MGEKVELLSEVLQVEAMSQQVCDLSRQTEELQQNVRTRLQSLEDAAEVQRKWDEHCFDSSVLRLHTFMNSLSNLWY